MAYETYEPVIGLEVHIQLQTDAKIFSPDATAFGAALMLMALILVSQFNSVTKPLIILTSVVMSTSGVLVGLMAFRMPFSIVMTGVGIISLAGIVVNNAIGLNFDFFGLYASLEPELYWGGEQAAWWGPMAIAVIVGILFATFLTLLLVPVLYSLLEEGVERFRGAVLGDGGSGEAAAVDP